MASYPMNHENMAGHEGWPIGMGVAKQNMVSCNLGLLTGKKT